MGSATGSLSTDLRPGCVIDDGRDAVTTPTRIRACAAMLAGSATVGDIVSYNDVRPRWRLRCAAALAVVAWALVIVGDLGMPWSDSPDTHGPHPVASAAAHEVAAIVDHSHLQADPMLGSPDTFIAAVLPRGTTMLVALGLLAAVATTIALWASATLVPVRGPPPSVAASLAGRSLLTRLCIARR